MPSNARAAYIKERRRIQNTMRRMEKQGFIYEENYLPTIPQRITQASVRRLREQYSTSTVKREAKYKVDLDTGEVQTAEEYRKQKAEETVRKMQAKRKTNRARRKGQATDVDMLIERFYEYVDQFAFARYYPHLKSYVSKAEKRFGKWELAKAIYDLWGQGIIPDRDILYDKDKCAEYIYLLGQKLNMHDENLEDMIEQDAWDYSDEDEYW